MSGSAALVLLLACSLAQATSGFDNKERQPLHNKHQAKYRYGAARDATRQTYPPESTRALPHVNVPKLDSQTLAAPKQAQSKAHSADKGLNLAPDDEVEEIPSESINVRQKPGPSTWWGDSWPQWDRVFDAYTPKTSRKHAFNTLISHRNYGGFAQQPFHSLFGFDKGLLKVGLGLRFGILERLDVGVARFNGTVESFNTYEFDLKYQVLTQQQFGLDLGLRAGLSWFEQYQSPDAVGALVQLLIGRLIFDRVYVGGGLLFHSNSSGPKKSKTDVNGSTAFQFYADGRILAGLSFALELTKNISGYSLINPVLTLGPRFITNRHTFSIVLTNSQYTDADGIVTGSDHTNFSSWMLGFNITREL